MLLVYVRVRVQEEALEARGKKQVQGQGALRSGRGQDQVCTGAAQSSC